MDLFASRLNYQMKPFASWMPDPEAEVVDSFTISWKNMVGYAFPPPGIIPAVHQKVRMEQAEIIIVVPDWPSKPGIVF